MRAALYNIFKKNLVLLMILLCGFVGIKILTANKVGELKSDQLELDYWVSQCADMNEQQIDEYISNLMSKLYSDENTSRQVIGQLSRLRSSLGNMKTVNNLIYFARHKEGELPTVLPDNYMELLDFYKNLDSPTVINERPLDIYFDLQQYSTVFFIAVLLTSFFFGKHYETEISKYTVTTKKGSIYNETVRLSVIAVSFIFLFANELFDLLYSGLLQNKYLLSASVQSYSSFKYTQMDAKLKDLILLMLLSKIAGTLVLCLLTEIIAKFKKNTKDTVVISVCVIVLFLFISKAISNTRFSPLMQLGIVDWKYIIIQTTLLFPSGCSTLLIGCMLTFTLTLFICVAFVICNKKTERF